MIIDILLVLVALAIGIPVGLWVAKTQYKSQMENQIKSQLFDIEKQIADAEKNLLTLEKEETAKEREIDKKISQMLTTAQKEANDIKMEAQQKEVQIEKERARIEEREKTLDEKVKDVEKQREKVITIQKTLEESQEKLETIISEEQKQLESIAGFSKEQAKEKLFETIEKTAEQDLVAKMHRMEERLKQELDTKARYTIVSAVQRIASDVTSENTISQVELENDEMKGRIIGKEGRNINAFERATGVNLVIDDTPNVVILSSFDPLRRYLAAEVLKELLDDGRIHPARIEEVMKVKQAEVDKMIQQLGENAIFETGVTGVPPELVKILGRLHFRTSYGQNVLRHSIECAFIAEGIANIVGANAELAKKAALLHDLGKTLSHEMGGKHALLSGEIARKFQLDEDLVHAIEAHHEDVPLRTVEAFIIQAADAISASRPGARKETSEKFVKRMVELEGIATSYKGVQKCYAMSAGREMWLFVNPEEISDLEASKLSWDITRRIETDVQYPGEIRVVMIRENRFVHTAT